MREGSDNTLNLNWLYKEYHQRMIRFAQTYVSSLRVAEDIVMESFMHCWENRSTLAPDSNLPAYLLTLVKHKCLNHLRQIRKKEEVENHLLDMETWELNVRIATLEACKPERLLLDEVQQIIDETLTTLPEQTQDIFIRSRYENQNHKQIAEN